VTDIKYLDFLKTIRCHNCSRIWPEALVFSKTAHPHTSISKSRHISLTCPIWIGQGKSITWPSQSPDLMPLDFLEINERHCLHSPFPTTLCQLCVWITDTIGEVDADMLRWIRDESAYRWDTCRVTRESHIEHL
jgi:hypothetical protein